MSERWDERYRCGDAADKPPDHLVKATASNLAPGAALDIACGAGRHTLWLAEHGWRVTAVDYSAVALGILRERSTGAIDLVRADLERGEYEFPPNQFDLVLDVCFLLRSLWPEIQKTVRPGGLFLGILPMEAPSDRPFNPAYLIGSGELAAAFAGWQILHSFEGRHPGRRARAELLARKPAVNVPV